MLSSLSQTGQSPRPVRVSGRPFLGLALHMSSIIVGKYGNANPFKPKSQEITRKTSSVYLFVDARLHE